MPDASGYPQPPPERLSLRRTKQPIRSDIAFRCDYEHKPFSWFRALRMMRHPGVSSVVRFRLQCFCYANHLSLLGGFFKYLNLVLYGIDLDHRARIGGGLYIGHAGTMVVTEGVTLGERCVLLHQNTIGLSPYLEPGRAPGPVIVGDDVTFGGGSCAYGDIVIGDNCRIGVNAVVDRSFPAGSSLFGVPAKLVASHAR